MPKFKKVSLSFLVVLIYIIVIPIVDFNHQQYKGKEGVVVWDIKSYYAYLPAAFIQKDLTLKFYEKDIQTWGKWIWPIETPTGKKAILTTMGMSCMYSPFFLIAHEYAKISGKYAADGYSFPYHVALTFSAWVYFILGLIFLRKLLLRYFSDTATAFTILIIGFGTNLFYYVTYEAPMSHAYSFALISIFIYLVDQWRENSYNWKYSILLGLLAGLITLIRPTNAVALLLIPLFGIAAMKDFGKQVPVLLRQWPKIIVMALLCILVWVPQFLYWHEVSGQFLFFSYGEDGSAFYFNHPRLLNILFSYRKGWFIYTPVMLFAATGIVFLFKQKRPFSFAVLIFFLVNLFILSSWWSWWFGGGYSNRAFIDSYGLMALPLAALIDEFRTKKIAKALVITFLLILTSFNLFQIQQYRHQAIHYYWMNKEAYWEDFLKSRPTCKYFNILNQPDVLKARTGIYEAVPIEDDKISKDDLFSFLEAELKDKKPVTDSLQEVSQRKGQPYEQVTTNYINYIIYSGQAKAEYKALRIAYLKSQMEGCKSWRKEIERKALKNDLTFDRVASLEAERIFNAYSQKYIKKSVR